MWLWGIPGRSGGTPEYRGSSRDWGWLRHLPLHLLLLLSSEAKAVECGVAPCTVSIWMLALVLQLKAIVWVRPKFYTGSTGISWNCGVFSRCYSSDPFTLCHKQCWRGLPNHSVTHSLASNMLLLLVEQLEPCSRYVYTEMINLSWMRSYMIIPVMSGSLILQLI